MLSLMNSYLVCFFNSCDNFTPISSNGYFSLKQKNTPLTPLTPFYIFLGVVESSISRGEFDPANIKPLVVFYVNKSIIL